MCILIRYTRQENYLFNMCALYMFPLYTYKVKFFNFVKAACIHVTFGEDV